MRIPAERDPVDLARLDGDEERKKERKKEREIERETEAAVACGTRGSWSMGNEMGSNNSHGKRSIKNLIPLAPGVILGHSGSLLTSSLLQPFGGVQGHSGSLLVSSPL